MESKGLESFKGKRLKIFLKHGIIYTGTISELYDHTFLILDKYDNTVLVNYDVIERIEVVPNATN